MKDYLDGATVLFDAAGNVVDGCLQGDYSLWVISPRGVQVSFTWSDLSNKKFVGVGFTEDTSRKILDLLTRLHQAPTEETIESLPATTNRGLTST